MTEPDNRCLECDGPVDIWDDKSVWDNARGEPQPGITVNFRCLNFDCKSGKGPWDTPPPPLPGHLIPLPRIESHATLRSLRKVKTNINMRIELARKAGDKRAEARLLVMRNNLKRARKAFLQKEGMT